MNLVYVTELNHLFMYCCYLLKEHLYDLFNILGSRLMLILNFLFTFVHMYKCVCVCVYISLVISFFFPCLCGSFPGYQLKLISLTVIFHIFFISQARSKYLFFVSIVVRWNGKIHYLTSFFLLSRLLPGIEWSFLISKFQRILCVSFSKTDSVLWIHHLSTWLNFLSLT